MKEINENDLICPTCGELMQCCEEGDYVEPDYVEPDKFICYSCNEEFIVEIWEDKL